MPDHDEYGHPVVHPEDVREEHHDHPETRLGRVINAMKHQAAHNAPVLPEHIAELEAIRAAL